MLHPPAETIGEPASAWRLRIQRDGALRAVPELCHLRHRNGLFTISDQYEVEVHPKARLADHRAFPLLDLDRTRIALPAEEANFPHQKAIEWHRAEVFGRFAR